jgi:hypothetical protein
LRLVVAPPVCRLEVSEYRLELTESCVESLSTLALGSLESFCVFGELVNKRKGLFELLIDRLLVLLEPFRGRRRNKRINVALHRSLAPISINQHRCVLGHTFPSVYRPYDAPPTTVAMMNQSRQSLLGTSGGGGCHAYGGYCCDGCEYCA